MNEHNNLVQLKKLAAKMTGKNINDIDAATIAEALNIIQANYTGGGGGAGPSIQSVVINVNGELGINNGNITMSNGDIIDIVISQIETITLKAAEGSGTNLTKITVVQPTLKSGNHYRVKVGDIITPATNEDLTSWSMWNGTDDISASNGAEVHIAECDKNNKAVRCGICKAVAPLF